jgi:hypothetical protein
LVLPEEESIQLSSSFFPNKRGAFAPLVHNLN